MKVIRIQAETLTAIPDNMTLAEARNRAEALIKLALQEIGITAIEMLEIVIVEED